MSGTIGFHQRAEILDRQRRQEVAGTCIAEVQPTDKPLPVMPRELREAIVRYTASMSGILPNENDRKYVNSALLDVASIALRQHDSAIQPNVRSVLESARAAIWDAHYGKGLSVEYARSVSEAINEVLARPDSRGGAG